MEPRGRLGTVYMLKNQINGKKYIGQTIDLRRRIRQHVKRTRQVIDEAIDIYGMENFEVSVLEENIPIDRLNETERFWIKKYNTYKGQDYNLAEGGKRVGSKHHPSGADHPHTDMTIEKVRKILLDRIENEEPITVLGEKYGVNPNTIYSILEGQHWTVRNGELQHLINKAPKRSELISKKQRERMAGGKNPSAKGDPEEARRVLEMRLRGMASNEISANSIYGRQPIMEIIRGEHWTLEDNEELQELASKAPNSFRGRSLDSWTD